MPPLKKDKAAPAMLVNKLSVEDARHLLRSEGGELSSWQFALELISVAAVTALTARAIGTGGATAWHLVLPMAAQYLALLVALPVAYAFVRHSALRREALQSLPLLAGLAGGVIVATVVRGQMFETPWQTQLASDATDVWRWIADAEMQWPLLLAAIGITYAFPNRIRNLLEHGPPFVGASLGCAMRLLVLVVGLFLLPMVSDSATRLAWSLWGLLLLADLLAVLMHWDIQRRLRKIDGPPDEG